MREKGERGKEIEVSTAVSVLLCYKGGSAHSQHEPEDSSSNLSKITGAAKQLFPGQRRTNSTMNR